MSSGFLAINRPSKCTCRISSLMASFYKILLISSLLHFGHAAKFLIPGSIMRGHGHTTLLAALSAELTSRGHHVTILVPSDDKLKVRQKFKDARATNILEYPTMPFEESDYLRSLRAGNAPSSKFSDALAAFNEVAEEQVSYCRQLLNNTSIMHKLNGTKFDLIIEDMANGCDVLLPEVLNVPFVALSSTTEMPYMNYNIFGFPLELSYVITPFLDGGADRHLSFTIRSKNLVMRVFGWRLLDCSSSFTSLRQEFDISPDESMHELARKAKFWLSQDSHVLEGAHPTMPNYSPVGGLAAARPGVLSSEFQEFADGSGDAGFIVFSTGSIVSCVINSDLVESIASLLNKFPHRVIWKHDGSRPRNLGSNTKISPWIPQAALLAYPKARLLIGHGGLNGIYEALYHGVPMVLMPQMMMDQKYNALKVERYGYGVRLDKTNFSVEALESRVYQVLNDSRFTERSRRCSEILQDDDPMDRAVYWIEHVLKFGGNHLRPGVFDLNLIQYYMIDVFAVLLLFVLVLILMLCMIVKACVATLCKRKSFKVKAE